MRITESNIDISQHKHQFFTHTLIRQAHTNTSVHIFVFITLGTHVKRYVLKKTIYHNNNTRRLLTCRYKYLYVTIVSKLKYLETGTLYMLGFKSFLVLIRVLSNIQCKKCNIKGHNILPSVIII